MGFCFYLMGIAYAQYPFEVITCALSFYTSFLIKKIKVSEKLEKKKKKKPRWMGRLEAIP